SSKIDVGGSTVFDVNNVTLEAWINAANWPVNNWSNIICKDQQNSPWWGFGLRGENDNASLAFLIALTGTEIKLTAPRPSAGAWHHVVGVYDGATMSLYIDGSLANSAAHSGAMGTDTGQHVVL